VEKTAHQEASLLVLTRMQVKINIRMPNRLFENVAGITVTNQNWFERKEDTEFR
jgi:uncharacterized protein (UPF0303 family)